MELLTWFAKINFRKLAAISLFRIKIDQTFANT